MITGAPSPARWAHFDDVHEQAVIVRPRGPGTRNPEPSRGAPTASAAKARVTKTTDAYSTPARSIGRGRAAGMQQGRGGGDRVRRGRRRRRRRFADRYRPSSGRRDRARCRRRAHPAGVRLGRPIEDLVQPIDELFHAEGQAEEQRGVGIGRRPAGHRPGPLDQARMGGRRGQLGGAGADAQPIGVAGVDPAEQRADETVEGLVAEPIPDQTADRGVVAVGQRCRRGVEVGPQPVEPPGR